MTGARLSLAARFLWAARPLWVIQLVTVLLVGAALQLFEGLLQGAVVAAVIGATFAWGSLVTVPVVVHRELVAQARQVSPPM